jgi:Flp pilus assembly pilin Flp
LKQNRRKRFERSCSGQDLIEYALMAALVATGVVTMSPAVAASFADILSKVNSVVVVAGSN